MTTESVSNTTATESVSKTTATESVSKTTATESVSNAIAAESVPAADLRLKVLVADDNRDAADSLAMLLELNGHEVIVVHTGEAALTAATRDLPHAMILDIGMPDLSGYDVARRIRATDGGGSVLLVAVTGWGQDDDKVHASAAGFNHHLTKPIDPDHIERLIKDRFCPA
jgi:CheY-like chemotaxis protein